MNDDSGEIESWKRFVGSLIHSFESGSNANACLQTAEQRAIERIGRWDKMSWVKSELMKLKKLWDDSDSLRVFELESSI
ncbi:hypothetical protein L1987_03945 [Smallanthus sonchifolius]|uniref:Uncharacterized protein n=1 Tax=Smallanthus sonchifolius TaxID=185202 RepID=A0ACB9KC07_9ASTR|nr:hypothetical protein L1987_03945 [Smallanthus sonchifolius]